MCTYMNNIHTHVPNTHTCTTYTHMHHQTYAPPNTTKYRINLVGLTSVLYERPSPKGRFVFNQLFFMCFSQKPHTFHENCMLFMKTALFTKTTCFSWKPQCFSLWAFGLSPRRGRTKDQSDVCQIYKAFRKKTSIVHLALCDYNRIIIINSKTSGRFPLTHHHLTL